MCALSLKNTNSKSKSATLTACLRVVLVSLDYLAASALK